MPADLTIAQRAAGIIACTLFADECHRAGLRGLLADVRSAQVWLVAGAPDATALVAQIAEYMQAVLVELDREQ